MDADVRFHEAYGRRIAAVVKYMGRKPNLIKAVLFQQGVGKIFEPFKVGKFIRALHSQGEQLVQPG